ncbi:ribonuclease H-like domain-containing protein [Tanacetum coccineum]
MALAGGHGREPMVPAATLWTTKEEITLCKGWLAVSENSKDGNAKKQSGFWVEVLEYIESKTKQYGRRTYLISKLVSAFTARKETKGTSYNVQSKQWIQGQIDGRATYAQICDHWATYAQELFDFIALSLKKFVEQMGNNMQISHVRDIGFMFSYPMKETSVS